MAIYSSSQVEISQPSAFSANSLSLVNLHHILKYKVQK